ncbi:MAG: hypothetical protein O2871_01980, partial [bacterium]|nr:hypothetical protein [bacterium]
MWRIEIEEEIFIFEFEEKIDDETGILTSVVSYKLEQEREKELEQFKETGNVHQITLQETRQQLYVESKTDLHADFENLEGSGVKVSGYEIRMIGSVLEAKFGNNWYSLESATDKDSDIYQLLSKVTEAMKNGQTAVTVTSHGMSPATNKKFEIKTNSVEYIINVFDIKAGKAYNYILVDKTLDDVKEILAKYGIELNLENPDLTFGTVNDNKEAFEKDNFINSAETIQTDLSTMDFEQTPNLPTSFESVTYPFIAVDLPDFQTGIEFENDVISPEFLQEKPTVKAEVLEINEPEPNSLERIEDDPDKPPKLDKGIILIFNTDSENSEVIFGQNGQEPKGVVAERGQIPQVVGTRENETAGQVHVVKEAMRMEELVPEVSVSKHSLNTDVLNNQTVSAQELAEQVIEEQNKPTSTPKVDVYSVEQALYLESSQVLSNGFIESVIGSVIYTPEVSVIYTPEVSVIEQVQEDQVSSDIIFTQGFNSGQPTSTFGVDVGLIEPLQTLGVDNGVGATILQQQIAEQVVLLQQETGLETIEEEKNHRRLYASVDRDRVLTWPHTMTVTEALEYARLIKVKTGKDLIEIWSDESDKLQFITR